ncbi:MAG: cation diffusion facilitator family transporter [Planctomycetes bacterium]|nr:cation diffusion facilitator family transporter [Planctomycetota bacterium]MBL7008018.1 cation diffusion facilitator family transporter [Planctomycetota bacterium]
MAASSKTAVLAALVGNSVLTVLKFGAFLVSGSGAMLSEAIHTAADAANQALLFIGLKRSLRPGDRRHPYGYGGERFLFALLSAVGIFVFGCGVTVYHGVHIWFHPPELSLSWHVFAVLLLSLLVDGLVLVVAARAVWAQKGEKSLFEYLHTATDPSAIAVLLEDAVACLGVLIALGCIGLAHLTGEPRWDALGSILIGLLMGGIAIWLGVKNRELLLGRAASPELVEAAVDFLRSQPSVLRVSRVRSRVVSADDVKLQVDLDFNGAWFGRQLDGWARARLPQPEDRPAAEQFAEDFGRELIDRLGLEVDRLERELTARFPRLRFIELEAD